MGNDKCQLYVIRTRYDIDFLLEILEYPEYFQVVYAANGRDTFRHLALLSQEQVSKLTSENWPFIAFRPYLIDSEHNLPSSGDTDKLFIKLPYGHGKDFYMKKMNERLALYAKYSALPEKSWRIDIPQRYAGDIVGHCIIDFQDEVTVLERAYVCIMLNHDSWDHCDERIRCQWLRSPKTFGTWPRKTVGLTFGNFGSRSYSPQRHFLTNSSAER